AVGCAPSRRRRPRPPPLSSSIRAVTSIAATAARSLSPRSRTSSSVSAETVAACLRSADRAGRLGGGAGVHCLAVDAESAWFAGSGAWRRVIDVVSGGILIAMGALLMTNNLLTLTSLLSRLLPTQLPDPFGL